MRDAIFVVHQMANYSVAKQLKAYLEKMLGQMKELTQLVRTKLTKLQSKTMAALKRRGTQPLSETSLDIGERLPSMSTASKANSRKTSLASVSIEIPDVEHSTGSSDGEDSPVEQSAAAALFGESPSK